MFENYNTRAVPFEPTRCCILRNTVRTLALGLAAATRILPAEHPSRIHWQGRMDRARDFATTIQPAADRKSAAKATRLALMRATVLVGLPATLYEVASSYELFPF